LFCIILVDVNVDSLKPLHLQHEMDMVVTV